jgi:hypothetical protein
MTVIAEVPDRGLTALSGEDVSSTAVSWAAIVAGAVTAIAITIVDDHPCGTKYRLIESAKSLGELEERQNIATEASRDPSCLETRNLRALRSVSTLKSISCKRDKGHALPSENLHGRQRIPDRR